MKEKTTIRRFVVSDAAAVQDIIHRGLREINIKDYPVELIEEYCNYFTGICSFLCITMSE